MAAYLLIVIALHCGDDDAMRSYLLMNEGDRNRK
jgi:hypothetical protein